MPMWLTTPFHSTVKENNQHNIALIFYHLKEVFSGRYDNFVIHCATVVTAFIFNIITVSHIYSLVIMCFIKTNNATRAQWTVLLNLLLSSTAWIVRQFIIVFSKIFRVSVWSICLKGILLLFKLFKIQNSHFYYFIHQQQNTSLIP